MTEMIRMDYDTTANAGYLTLRPGEAHSRTEEVHDGVFVDLDAEGRIVGVESIVGPVDLLDLALLLTKLRWPVDNTGGAQR